MSTTIGQKLRDLRKLEELSQRELSEITGIAKGTIHKWENGETAPTTTTLDKLIRHPRFKHYAAWLVTDENTTQETPTHHMSRKLSQLNAGDLKLIDAYVDLLLLKQKQSTK